MVDIQSAMAEIRRGKKKRRRRTNDRMKMYMACPITQGGHKLSLCIAPAFFIMLLDISYYAIMGIGTKMA